VIGEPRIHVPECASTQALLDDPALPEGAIATTDHQTGGRGRLGRQWVDAPGTSVLVSVLLLPPPERRAAELSLVAGLAAAEAVESATGLAAQLKWPNDVMLDRRKVAGVLPELREGRVVVGIGINVNQPPAQLPERAVLPAGSLRTVTGREYDREAVLALLLRALDRRYAEWRAAGLAALHADLGARNFLYGRRVRVDGAVGVARSIHRDGRLEIELPTGPRLVESGEVVLVV
jgi:biotin-[acetyl-CoA-carboxylase] ligase BirA-like protein